MIFDFRMSIFDLSGLPSRNSRFSCGYRDRRKLIRFLEHANVAFAGSRDRDLVPFGHRVSGWRIGADQRTMTIFFPDEFLHQLTRGHAPLVRHGFEVVNQDLRQADRPLLDVLALGRGGRGGRG